MSRLAFAAIVSKRIAFVRGYVVGLVAFDFILGIIFGRMMRMPLVVKIFGMDSDDRAGDPAGLGVPADMIPHFEIPGHGVTPAAVKADEPDDSAQHYFLARDLIFL